MLRAVPPFGEANTVEGKEERRVSAPSFMRRKRIVDGRFQIRWAMRIAMAGAVTATVFSVLLWRALQAQNAVLRESVEANQAVHEIALDVGVLFLNLPGTTEEEAQQINARLEDSKRGFERSRRNFIDHLLLQRWIALGLVAFVMVLAGILFAWGILVSHRVAGPMFVIKRTLERFHADGTVESRSLRRGDEFQDVYAAVCRTLRERNEEAERARQAD